MRAIYALFASLHLLACVSLAADMSFEEIAATFEAPHVNLDKLSHAFQAWERFNEHASADQKKLIVKLIADIDIDKLQNQLGKFITQRAADDYTKQVNAGALLVEPNTEHLVLQSLHGSTMTFDVNLRKARHQLLMRTLPGVDLDVTETYFLQNFLDTDSLDRTKEVLAYLKAHPSEVPDILLSHVATQFPYLNRASLRDALDDFERRVQSGELTKPGHRTVPLISVALIDPVIAEQAVTRNPGLFTQPRFIDSIAITAGNEIVNRIPHSKRKRRRLANQMIQVLLDQEDKLLRHLFEGPEWLTDRKTQRKAFQLLNRLDPELVPTSVLVQALPDLEFPFNQRAIEALKTTGFDQFGPSNLAKLVHDPNVDRALKRWYPELRQHPEFVETVAFIARDEMESDDEVKRAMEWIDPKRLADHTSSVLEQGFDNRALAKYLANPEHGFLDDPLFSRAALENPEHLSASESETLIRYLRDSDQIDSDHRWLALESTKDHDEFRKGAVAGFWDHPLIPGLPVIGKTMTIASIFEALMENTYDEEGRLRSTHQYVFDHVARSLTPRQLVGLRPKLAEKKHWYERLLKQNLEYPGIVPARKAFIRKALEDRYPFENLELALRLIEKYPRFGVPHLQKLAQLINFDTQNSYSLAVPSIQVFRGKIYDSLLSDSSVPLATRHRFLGQLSRTAHGIWPNEIVADLKRKHRFLRVVGPIDRARKGALTLLDDLCGG